MHRITLQTIALGCLFLVHLGDCGSVAWECDRFLPSDPLGGCEWQIVELHNPQNMAAVRDPHEPDLHSPDIVLRAFYPNGSYAGNREDKGGFEFWSTPFPAGEDMTLSYEVRFSDGFDFVRGGKLPGFYGGTEESCNATYCDRCSGTLRGECFSTRYMWDRQGEGYVYAYLPGDEGFGRELGRDLFWFEPGKWHRISQRLVMNTPGEENGIMEIYFEGEQIYRADDIRYRINPEVRITVLFFSTFFGGSSVPDFAATDDCYSYYRNFVVTSNE